MIIAFYSRMSSLDHLFITIMLRTGVESYLCDKYGQQYEKPVFKISHKNCSIVQNWDTILQNFGW